ncbi:PH domain-containing protein [Bacillus sinesaloumensis]|uniref:PH domain-containing protein n=1 Tax=Litchfieldia sinesaloumensis TaxID=1926280 RepID=UPI0009885526|nr:PH domain-containing protein [Bacillus sinesaloumensis]
MVFRSKVDWFFLRFILIVLLVVALVCFLPLFLDDVPFLAVIILTSIFVIMTSFMLVSVFSIRYIFHEEYLLIKGWPIRSRIPYEHITKVSPTTKIFTGHNMLSSRDALEIFNRKTYSGSVKVSPENKTEFLAELKKRCPNLEVHD